MTQLHLNRTHCLLCREQTELRGPRGAGESCADRSGGWLGPAWREVLGGWTHGIVKGGDQLSDRLEVAEKGARKLRNGWVTGNFIPCAELGRTRRGLEVKGFDQGLECRRKVGSHRLSMEF